MTQALSRTRLHPLRCVAVGCALLCSLLHSPWAQAAYNCNLSSTSVNGVYTVISALRLTGMVTVSCTRALSDPNTFTYAITLDDGLNGKPRRLYQHGATSPTARTTYIDHSISQNTFGGSAWGSTPGTTLIRTLNFGSGSSASANHTYYFEVNARENNKTAGIFDDVLTFSLMQGSATGPLMATSSITPTASIVSACFVGPLGLGNFAAPGAVAPSTMTLNYTSFSSTPVSSNMMFTINCTQGTPYTLSLSPASGTLLGLSYSLNLSRSSGTGSGFAQSVTVTGTVAAGQSGTCALASCSASRATTVTITY